MNIADAIETLEGYPDDAEVVNLSIRHRGKVLVLSEAEDDIEIEDDVQEVLVNDNDWPPDYED